MSEPVDWHVNEHNVVVGSGRTYQQGWDAAIAECVRRLRERSVTPSYHQWRVAAAWLEEDMKK